MTIFILRFQRTFSSQIGALNNVALDLVVKYAPAMPPAIKTINIEKARVKDGSAAIDNMMIRDNTHAKPANFKLTNRCPYEARLHTCIEDIIAAISHTRYVR